MPYDERTIEELEASAEITPPGIQLEVNTEIFVTIRNLLSGLDGAAVSEEDEAELYGLWRRTQREMARVELRRGYGFSMAEQIDMLREAFAIERRYIPDQVFRPVTGSMPTPELIEKESEFQPEEMQTLFEEKVWPAVAARKTGNQERPTAYIVAGQPGAGKTIMSSLIIEKHDGDIIQSMVDNFRGFHPHDRELMRKYGSYCAYFTIPQAKCLSELTLARAAEGRYHILQEGSLEHVEETLAMIRRLKEAGYRIIVLLRACPGKVSWKAIHQLFLQQRLKAPGLSRIITKKYHDAACRSFLSATNELIAQNLMDRLIIKSPRGLLYDSEDMPTERVADILAERMGQ